MSRRSPGRDRYVPYASTSSSTYINRQLGVETEPGEFYTSQDPLPVRQDWEAVEDPNLPARGYDSAFRSGPASASNRGGSSGVKYARMNKDTGRDRDTYDRTISKSRPTSRSRSLSSDPDRGQRDASRGYGCGDGPREAGRDRRDFDEERARAAISSQGEDVMAALTRFTSAMHQVLLSTSAHAIAARHASRMSSFDQFSPGSAIARDELNITEVNLMDRMKDLHGAFTDLMRKTLPSPTALVPASDSPVRRRSEVSSIDLEVVRDRIRQLERRMEDIPPPPPPPASPPAPSPPALPTSRDNDKAISLAGDEELEGGGGIGKRSRARALVEDMLSRLQAVEAMKDTLEDKYTDLENLMNAKLQDEMEIERMGNRSWRIVEDLRDPDGVLRGIKRKREARDDRLMAQEERSAIDTSAGPSGRNTMSTSETAASASGSAPLAFEKVAPTSPTGKAQPIIPPDPAIAVLQREVEALKAEIAEVKVQETEKQKQLSDRIIAKLNKDFEGILGERLKSMAKQITQDMKEGRPKPSLSTQTAPLPDLTGFGNGSTPSGPLQALPHSQAGPIKSAAPPGAPQPQLLPESSDGNVPLPTTMNHQSGPAPTGPRLQPGRDHTSSASISPVVGYGTPLISLPPHRLLSSGQPHTPEQAQLEPTPRQQAVNPGQPPHEQGLVQGSGQGQGPSLAQRISSIGQLRSPHLRPFEHERPQVLAPASDSLIDWVKYHPNSSRQPSQPPPLSKSTPTPILSPGNGSATSTLSTNPLNRLMQVPSPNQGRPFASVPLGSNENGTENGQMPLFRSSSNAQAVTQPPVQETGGGGSLAQRLGIELDQQPQQ